MIKCKLPDVRTASTAPSVGWRHRRGVARARSHEELADDDAEQRHADRGGDPRHQRRLLGLLGPVRVPALHARLAALRDAEQLLLKHARLFRSPVPAPLLVAKPHTL